MVDRQIRRFSGLRFCWLVFPRELEMRFEAETAPARCARMWLEMLIGLAVANMFLVVECLMTPRGLMLRFLTRALVIIPAGLAVALNLRRGPGRVVREGSIAAISCLSGLSCLYVVEGRGQVASAYVQLGVLAIVLFATVMMRLRFLYALAVAVTISAADMTYLWLDSFLGEEQKIFGACLMVGTVMMTLLANYSFGREERLNFLLQVRSDLLVSDLNRLNAALKLRSESDALTGLANRHSFDTHFARLWREAFVGQTVLSMVVVDVDYFKDLNDRYGHLYGDEVLKRIATLLQQALRVKTDFAARFGGEEFVILLPETDEASAMHVAERVRLMVGIAGFPALDPEFGRHDDTVRATVSCGVASAVPESMEGRERLLEAADVALYRAKAAGRNCVQRAPVESRMVAR